ncbi:MAG: restriction endonuclease [Candidatus Aenigmarchaeota archaeon]|nr:restriction endonuclease [Candidatus Aenigmarchaeota archaeon]
MTFVTKFDGSKQEFQKEKIIRTCLRMHASKEIAEKIADKIESKAYEGIQTKKILQMIFGYLEEYKPEIKYQIDLREAICLLRPNDFEQFVILLLREYGYEVSPPQIIRGRCVEHEVDGIAKKGNETICVEVKHHFQPHTYTGIDVCLKTQATIEDLKEGFTSGLDSINFDKALIVCNTKFSDHAKQYASCKGIELIGWKMPLEHGLEQLIEKKKLYPITFLKSVDKETGEKLAEMGILMIKQLVKHDVEELERKTKISRRKLRTYINEAKRILSVKD